MKIREDEAEEEEKVEIFSEVEEEGDNHLTKLRLNASNVTNLNIFNTNVLLGKKNYDEVEDTMEQEDGLLLMAHVDVNQQKEDEWFLDSGCSNHMSGNKEWFSKLDENFHNIVKLGNDADKCLISVIFHIKI